MIFKSPEAVIIAILVLTGFSLPWVTYSAAAQTQTDLSFASASQLRHGGAVTAESSEGMRCLFGANRSGGRLKFSLSNRELDRPFLMVWFDGSLQSVIRWVAQGESVALVVADVESTAGSTISPAIHQPLAYSTPAEPVVASFPVVGRSGSETVIDVTNLFVAPIDGFLSLGGVWNNVDPARSSLDSVRCFKDVTEISVTQTINPSNRADELKSLKKYFALMALPETLMDARKFDPRFGFMRDTFQANAFTNDGDEFRTEKSNITKWRLTKKNQRSNVSDPIAPIIFYLDPNIPRRWRSSVRRGVEAWQAAFEQAGFSNAIIVRDAPENDPNWSMFSTRYSVIKWVDLSTLRQRRPAWAGISSGGGAQLVVDERTGEILRAVVLLESPLEIFQDWYFLQCAPLDPRAQLLPLPDELLGQLLAGLVSHEVGHALGLSDGNYGEFTYPTEMLRRAEWLKKMGHTPSIMNYARNNYVAQPEDNIPPELLLPKLGPADAYSILWAYSEPTSSMSADERAAKLEKLAARQSNEPWLRFVPDGNGNVGGPDRTKEAVDDSDPVASTTLGLMNLRRTIKILPTAVSSSPDNSDLERLYLRLVKQWENEILRVASLIGGVTTRYEPPPSETSKYSIVSRERQSAALKFLDANVWSAPTWLIDERVTSRIMLPGEKTLVISDAQIRILQYVLDIRRIHVLASADEDHSGGYSLSVMISELRRGIWREVYASSAEYDVFRERLQAAHLALVRRQLSLSDGIVPANGLGSVYKVLTPAERSIIVSDLALLRRDIDHAIDRIPDRTLSASLRVSGRTIDSILGEYLDRGRPTLGS